MLFWVFFLDVLYPELQLRVSLLPFLLSYQIIQLPNKKHPAISDPTWNICVGNWNPKKALMAQIGKLVAVQPTSKSYYQDPSLDTQLFYKVWFDKKLILSQTITSLKTMECLLSSPAAQVSFQKKLRSITDTKVSGADVTWHTGARHQCGTLKTDANCRGRQICFLLLPNHIHAKSEGGLAPLRCLLCLWHLLLSRVTTLTSCVPDTEL